MKNKKGKTEIKGIVIILIIVALLLALYLYSSQTNQKPLSQHKVPADISKSESGTGLKIRMWDEQGNELEVPDWFSAQSNVLQDYAIIRGSNKVCSGTGYGASSGCSPYTSNTLCWNSKCVQGNVGSFALDMGVQNPLTSQVNFTNVKIISSTTPAAFYTSANKTVVPMLGIGQSYTFFNSPMNITANGWVGTTQTFNVIVQGTNVYTGLTQTSSDSYILSFETDPSGSLIVSIVEVV